MVSMPDLAVRKFCPKQIFGNSSLLVGLSLLESQKDCLDPEQVRFFEASRISVSSSFVQLNVPWRQQNYSSRYLLFESHELQARGRPATNGLREKGLVEKAIACEQS